MLSTSRLGIKLASRRYLSVTKSRSASEHKAKNIADYRVVDHSFDAIVVGAGKQFEI
jgi:hypothetical protein